MEILETLKGWFGAEKRATLENPSTSLVEFLTGGSSSSGAKVSKDTALGLPAMYRGVRLLASTIASLPRKVYERVDEGKVLKPGHPAWPLVHSRANAYMTSYTFFEAMVANAVYQGNSYAAIDRDDRARPVSLMIWQPENVKPVVDQGELYYVFDNNKEKVLHSSSVLHFKGLGFDGVQGKPLLQVLKENIGGSLATQTHNNNFYKNGAKLDGWVKVPGKMDLPALKRLRDTWNSTINERTKILDAGMEYVPTGVNQEQAQFIETVKFGVLDVARILGIPPTLLYALDDANYSNAVAFMASFVKFDLRPWLVNFEQEMNCKLLTEEEIRTEQVFIEHNVEGLLRGSTKERTDAYWDLWQMGAMSANEIRRRENMNDIPGGDEYYTPQNMAPAGSQNEVE